ncbi:MAG: flagellar protein FlaG [Granulosicoccaceae bacterium]
MGDNKPSLQVDKTMMTNTDNSILPAGMNGTNRPSVAPVAAVTGKEVQGTGPSANRDTTVFASIKQGTVSSDPRATEQQQDPGLSDKGMEAVADALNRTFGEKQSLQFSVDQDTGVSVIKVMQSGTGEVVRQIPNEEALLMMQKLGTQQDFGTDTAVLFDQMA